MIRKAISDDIPQLGELFRQLHEHHINLSPESYRMPFPQYFELEMRSFFEDDALTVLVSECDGALTAYAVFSIFDRERAERTPAKVCYIEHFAVAESARRKGTGTELFQHIKAVAKEQGCDKIQLGAAASNAEALEFYSKQGMKPRTIKLELTL